MSLVQVSRADPRMQHAPPLVTIPRWTPRSNRPPGFSGIRDSFSGTLGSLSEPVVPIGQAGIASYSQSPAQNAVGASGLPCPDCPPNCTTTDEVVTMYVSPQQQSPNDKQIPVVRTGRVCEDQELDIDCDTSNAQPSLHGLGNASDTPVSAGDVLITTDGQSAPSDSSTTSTLLLVGAVAVVAVLATVALTSNTRRR